MSTELVFILDKSGSMEGLRDRTISDFNETLSQYQKDFPEAYITLVQFDVNYYPNYIHMPVSKAAPLSRETYKPGGGTALYDAVCRTIDDTGAKLAQLPDWARNDLKVVVAIFTDGEENSSSKFRSEDVQQRIEHQGSKYSWQFVYMGANQDAILAARKIGIQAANAVTMSNNESGRQYSNKAFYGKFASYVYSGNAAALNFDANDRAGAMQ